MKTQTTTPAAAPKAAPQDETHDEIQETLTPAAESPSPRVFEPGRYLTKVGGSDYLEVKWRLVWLRETHPEAIVETELMGHEDQVAIFRARVTVPGGGSATGWGTEAYGDFRDYVEKAETKALGRALAALGFGTQFCPDFDFGAAEGRVVDTPVDFTASRDRRRAGGNGGSAPFRPADDSRGGNSDGATGGVTPRQVKFIQAIARELNLSDDEVSSEAQRLYGRPIVELGRRDASAFIERLQARRDPASGRLAS